MDCATPRTPTNNPDLKPPSLAVVLKGYPRLSETFIAQEIHNLENAGVDITMFSLRHPTDKATHPVHNEVRARVVYLPEYLYQEPIRLLKGWWRARNSPGYVEACRLFRNDLKRDRTPNRVRRFGQALVLAAELPEHIAALYAHFLHTPASVTQYAAVMLGIPWACSAHAKDIYTTPEWEISDKLAHCQWLTTCTQKNHIHLRTLCVDPEKVRLNYHGIDLQRFGCRRPTYSDRDGHQRSDPVVILSVGRAVEKKGYSGLLDALAQLNPNLAWKFLHIGGGPLLSGLKKQAKSLGIADKIEWLGAQPQQTVLDSYRLADLFILNCGIDRHGDRDGLPNVMVEAQSQGLPVIGTNISGIPELVENGHNGLLVEPGRQGALVDSLETLITKPQMRRQYGEAGREKVCSHFDMNVSFSGLQELITELLAQSTRRQKVAVPVSLPDA